MRDQTGAGPRLRAVPAWARSLSQPWPELDAAPAALDPGETAGSLRRAKRLLREADKAADLPPGKIALLLTGLAALIEDHRTRLDELERSDLVERLRARCAGLPGTYARTHEDDQP